MKKCSTCKEEKPVTEFYKNRSKKDGFQDACKLCKRNLEVLYRQRPEIKEKRREQESARRQDLDYRKRGQEHSRRRRQQPETVARDRDHQRDYRSRPEIVERRRNERRNRRALEMAAVVDGAGLPDLALLVRFYEKACLFPGCTADVPTLDHVVPLSKGGKHTYANTQPLCLSHNSAKRNRHQADYRHTANRGNGKEGIVLLDISPL